MNTEAKLLSPPENFAVVQLPERKFPGVVFQGDTLAGLVQQIEQMRAQLQANELAQLAEELDALEDQLREVKEHYETVCEAHEISLPYPT